MAQWQTVARRSARLSCHLCTRAWFCWQTESFCYTWKRKSNRSFSHRPYEHKFTYVCVRKFMQGGNPTAFGFTIGSLLDAGRSSAALVLAGYLIVRFISKLHFAPSNDQGRSSAALARRLFGRSIYFEAPFRTIERSRPIICCPRLQAI
jgi:hypothetical protein